MLKLYRRHTETCAVHETKLAPRAKRFYKDCNCPIWIAGHTDTEIFPRRSTGLNDMVAAEAFRLSLMKKSKDQAVHGPKIDDCVDRFLSSRKHKLGDRTTGSYRLLLGRLTTYCAKRGVYFMHELTVDLLEDFKVDGLPDLADTTKGITVAKLRCFLREAFRRDWIASHLAEKVTRHDAVYEEKEPYSDHDVDLILAEALKLNGGRQGYASAPETFRLLLELMLETGMRAGDAIRFDPAAVQKGDSLWVYSYAQQKHKRSKKPKSIEAYLTDRLKTAIDKCKWLSPSRPFWFGSATNQYRLGYQVYDLMKTIGKRCGVADCRPHRLRDTFATRSLLRGISIGDVSRLLGHSSVKITETYYAKWIPARGRRLESVVAQSLVNA
jgi:integrase